MDAASKVTSKGQVTVPKAVPAAKRNACAESTGVGKVASFDRVDTIERIEPPPV